MEKKDNAAAEDYSDEARYDRTKALVTSLLKWLECEFFGVFIFLSILAMRVMMHTAADVIFGLIGLICYIVVLADFGLKEGSKARLKNTLRGDTVKPAFGYLLGLVSQIPAVISLILFAAGGSLPLFKGMNAGLWGIIDLFAPTMRNADMHSALWAAYPVLMLILAASVGICFGLGLKNEDLATKIIYKKQK